MSFKPIRLGIAGIGGYAGVVRDSIEKTNAAGPAPVELVAVCDPDQDTHAKAIAELKQQGVAVFDDYQMMLDLGRLDGVWLPLPIQLHKPFAEAAMAAGVPVMCEKPAAGTIDEVMDMIDARDRVDLPVAIGFQDVYDSLTLPTKRDLAAGRIGRISHVTLHACWPRNETYFARSPWAGRIRCGQNYVLDSPANNALAHFINIVLFLLGPDELTSVSPYGLEAELYRARDIENYDTCSLRIALPGDVTFLVLLTHAAETQHNPVTTFHGEAGTLTRTTQQYIWHENGKDPVVQKRDGKMRQHMVRRFAELVRGTQPTRDIAYSSLESAAEHSRIISGASQASKVHPVDPAMIKAVKDNQSHTVMAIAGIEGAWAKCAASVQMLHESGQFDFTRAAASIDLHNYNHFEGPA